MTLIITLKHRTMKYHRLFFTAAISAVMAACSGQKTIEFPVTDTVIDWMSVYKVSFADTATVVEGNFYGRPGYELKKPADMFYLRGQSDGAEYRLLGTSFAGDTVYVRFPDNWTVPFTFVFSPLKKGEESFDLVCGNESIRGIPAKERKGRYTMVIEGTLVDRPNTSRIILYPYNSDPRVNPYISIPVEDGKFSYRLEDDIRTVYELICWDDYCHGSWVSQKIFSDNGKVRLTIPKFSFEADCDITVDEISSSFYKEYETAKARIYVDRDGKDLMALQDSLYNVQSELYSKSLYFNEEYMALMDSASTSGYPDDLMKRLSVMNDSGAGLSEAGLDIRDRLADIFSRVQENTAEYCRENVDLAGYFLLTDSYIMLEYLPYPTDRARAAYKELFETVYSKKYPDHPFTEQMYNAIASEEIRPGGHFIDFSAPDLSGKVHTLSEKISGKVAVIDLWASWCRPCRRHSMALIPIYEEYKDKGFTVVGVAREQNGTEAMEAAIRKDGYPWLNLVELNDAGHIWAKYGAGHAGGRIVLVDANGIIMAVDPTADEVLEYLGSHCF